VLPPLDWPAADFKQQISEGQVHVWAWPIDPAQASFEKNDLQMLDAAELDRFHRYHFDADRIRFAIAHVNLRRILGAYLDCQPGQVSFSANRFGKPRVTADHPLTFNLSHSRHFAMLAIAIETEVGVDIEDVRPIELEVAQHYFSPVEQAALALLEGEDWLHGFYRCWTRKEAILKAEGVGLQLPLSSFDVSLLPGEPAMLLGVRPPTVFSCPWTLHHLETPSGTMGALAAGNSEAKVYCFRPKPA
jgi:4'-phosphopantetheinyl transferase